MSQACDTCKETILEKYTMQVEKMATPWLTDAGAGRRLRWSLDIVERCSDQWAEAAMVGCKKSVLQS